MKTDTNSSMGDITKKLKKDNVMTLEEIARSRDIKNVSKLLKKPKPNGDMPSVETQIFRLKEIIKILFNDINKKNIDKETMFTYLETELEETNKELEVAKTYIEELNTHTLLIGNTYYCKEQLKIKYNAKFNKDSSQWAVPIEVYDEAQKYVDTFNMKAKEAFEKVKENFKIGDFVNHKEFGKGSIEAVTTRGINLILTIRFEDQLRDIFHHYVTKME